MRFRVIVTMLETGEAVAWETKPFEPTSPTTEQEAKEAALGHFAQKLVGLREGQDFECMVDRMG